MIMKMILTNKMCIRDSINMRINEKNYVDKAEKVISALAEEPKVKNRGSVNIVPPSKLRTLLAMTADIYNQVLLYPSERLDDELLGRIEYLRVRVMYECGRDNEHKVETVSYTHLPKAEATIIYDYVVQEADKGNTISNAAVGTPANPEDPDGRSQETTQITR